MYKYILFGTFFTWLQNRSNYVRAVPCLLASVEPAYWKEKLDDSVVRNSILCAHASCTMSCWDSMQVPIYQM